MTPTYTLTYFHSRGTAEVSRMLFALAGVKYTDRRLTGEEWAKLKPETPFGQLPILEVDGATLCQTTAIEFFLAKQFGFAGQSTIEEAQVVMFSGCIKDTMQPLMKAMSAKDEELKEILAKYKDEQLPVFLTNLENLLLANQGGDGYLVGSKISYADLRLLFIFDFCAWKQIVISDKTYPKLVALRQRVLDTPQIKEWIATRPVSNM